MACQLKNITLEPTSSGETWGGLSFSVDESDDTQYAANLSRVRMTWKTSAGVAAITLDSNTAGHITITNASPYSWAFTVEPRLMSIGAGSYLWSIETTDANGIVDKNRISGTHRITTDPHA